MRLFADRARLLALVGIVAGVNGIATPIFDSIGAQGFLSAVGSLFGVSAVIWLALFTLERLSAEANEAERVNYADKIVAAFIFASGFAPVSMAASLGVFVGGAYCVVSSPQGSASRRIGIVLLALSCSLLWGRLLLVSFGPQMLAFDGSFVAWMAGTHSDGNLVYFAGLARPFAVGVYCSSLHNISLGVLLWTCVSQLLEIRVDGRWAATGAGVALTVFMVNALRLAAIAWYPEHFVTLHYGWLAQLFGVASLLVSVLVIMFGVHAATRARV